MLHVRLDGSVGELASDQPLGVEDGVGGVNGDLKFKKSYNKKNNRIKNGKKGNFLESEFKINPNIPSP